MRPAQRRRGPSLAMLLLGFELYQMSVRHGIPPVTLAAIGAQVAIYLRIIQLPWTSIRDVCISVDAILNQKKYLRLVLSQLEHADDWHLYYNMMSFAWKGRTLERHNGPVKFLLMLVVFTVGTALTYVGLNKVFAEVADDDSYLYHCAVGFSGVIFALKVLTTHMETSRMSYFMGIPIGSKYVVWAELVFIQMISPNASFVGHLAGILVGLAYVYGPLEKIISLLTDLITNNPLPRRGNNYHQPTGEGHRLGGEDGEPSPRGGRTAYPRAARDYSTRSRASRYGAFVPTGMSEEEQLRRATEESLRETESKNTFAPRQPPPYPTEQFYPSAPPPPPGFNAQPDFEEMRRRRLQRYDNIS